MGRLIAIMGNSGAGKTTLARQLGSLPGFMMGMEQHAERPYQTLFTQALDSSVERQRYGLANQVDYLLLRAEQELAIRQGSLDGVMDGGLEMDFFIFTRLFRHKGYLSQADFVLCQRMYQFLRQVLPAPDVMIYLIAPVELVARRYAQRGRAAEIAGLADLNLIDNLLVEWRQDWLASPVLTVDASIDDPGFEKTSQRIHQELLARFETI